MNSTTALPSQTHSALFARLQNVIPGADKLAHGSVRGLIREVGSFGLIGIANAAIDMILFTAIHAGAGIGPLSAKVVSGLLTTVASYYANRRWTWPHRPGADARRQQLIQFTGISAVGLAIAEACLGVSHYLLGLHSLTADNLAANVVGLGFGFVWRFYASRRWVVTADTAADRAPAAPATVHVRSWSVPQQCDDWASTAPIDVSLTELFAAATHHDDFRDRARDTWRVA